MPPSWFKSQQEVPIDSNLYMNLYSVCTLGGLLALPLTVTVQRCQRCSVHYRAASSHVEA